MAVYGAKPLDGNGCGQGVGVGVREACADFGRMSRVFGLRRHKDVAMSHQPARSVERKIRLWVLKQEYIRQKEDRPAGLGHRAQVIAQPYIRGREGQHH
jgi:hypothetical protein